MGALKIKPIDSHVVDILGSTKGRDQPIMLMAQALRLIEVIGEKDLLDPNTVFFDPFCKAGEIILAAAIKVCLAKKTGKDGKLISYDAIEKELYNSNRFYALAPDKRHYFLSVRTFFGNDKSHNEQITKIFKNGDYLSEVDGTLEIENYNKELAAMIEFIKKSNAKAKIIAIGNPPYQENYDGDGSNTGANPIYHLFLDALMKRKEVDQFVMVIPSRWFAGGRGKALKDFATKLRTSNQVKQIYDFEDSKEVFPTVDIKGGVCFLHWSSQYSGKTKFVNVQEKDSSEIDLSKTEIIIRDSISRSIVEKVNAKSDSFISEIAWSWNPFNLPSNYFEKNAECKNGDLVCFTKRMIEKSIKKNKITKNADKIEHYKVAYPKAVKTGGVPYSKDQLFVLGKNEICTESYMVVDSFKTAKEADKLLSYLQNDFVRFLVSLKKITQDITKETWLLVPTVDLSKSWTDAELYAHFKITKEEQEFIKKKAKEW